MKIDIYRTTNGKEEKLNRSNPMSISAARQYVKAIIDNDPLSWTDMGDDLWQCDNGDEIWLEEH